MQIIHISGFLSHDPEVSTTQGGDKVCRLNVPVKQGWGEKEQTNWFRVSLWGKRAESLGNSLRKGVKVNVVGELTIGSYEGKPQYDVRAIDVDFPPQGKRDDRDDGLTHRNQDGFNQRRQPDYDDSDSVPF
mgnify:CR=1 FL=1